MPPHSLPSAQEFAPSVARALLEVARQNEGVSYEATRFHSSRLPDISFEDYVRRLAKYMQCSDACFVAALIYVDRVVQRRESFVFNNLALHRMYLTALMTAAKFFDDIYYEVPYYAKVGGLRPAELAALELEFLLLVDFELMVSCKTYDLYTAELTHTSALQPFLLQKLSSTGALCSSVLVAASAGSGAASVLGVLGGGAMRTGSSRSRSSSVDSAGVPVARSC